MKNTHRAFTPPLRSWLRKMSMNTAMSSQIQRTNTKNMNIVQMRSRIG